VHAFKLTIAYDGTGFVGWQRQPKGTSIQGLLEDALRELDGRDVAVAGAGRTDGGVHALAQVASITLARSITGRSLIRALNTRLPAAVRVIAAEAVASSFHARFDARSKTYRYRLWNAEALSPFERSYVWHIPEPLPAVAAMSAAAQRVVGRHDFAAFRGTGSASPTSEREVFSSVVRSDGPLITYEVSGDGFLRHMVRNIVGTLVEIGRGRRPPEWIDDVLASRSRAAAGRTAPPGGLFLVHVQYGPGERSLRLSGNTL
jgi:tRNA pseudouridine38-40 synthase